MPGGRLGQAGGYGETVQARLEQAGLRAKLDTRDEKLGFKIREAQLPKVPYMLVVGGREEESGTVSVRLRTEEDLGGRRWRSWWSGCRPGRPSAAKLCRGEAELFPPGPSDRAWARPSVRLLPGPVGW